MEEVKKEVKKNKKKNKVASLLLALALILTCGVAGTIAQYQKSFGGKSTASVATFKVSAIGQGNDTTFNPFNYVKTSDGVTDESHVAKRADGKTTKIAPGTFGAYTVDLQNDSDVDVKYSLDVSLLDGGIISSYTVDTVQHTNEVIPLEFYCSDTEITNPATTITSSQWVKLKDIVAAKNNSQQSPLAALTGTINKNAGSTATKKMYIYWRWAMGDDTTTTQNDLDTAIGEAMANSGTTNDGGTFTEPEMKVAVKFTQID